MLPLVFLPGIPVLLVGRGPAFVKRLNLLEAAGIEGLVVHTDAADAALVRRLGERLRSDLPTVDQIAAARLLFVAGVTRAEAGAYAAHARANRVPVNVEDVPEFCDVHLPAMVRRGRLLITVSTAGAAPGLAAALRGWLEDAFGPEWAGRLEEVAALRARLRAAGAAPAAVMQGMDALLAAHGWPSSRAAARCRPAVPAPA